MLVILLNCVTLGMYQPCDDMECLSDRCKILQVSLSVVPFLSPICVLFQAQDSTVVQLLTLLTNCPSSHLCFPG